MKITVDSSTVELYVDTMCDLMVSEPKRIRNDNEVEFTDTQTQVRIQVQGSDKWVIRIPGSKSFVLDKKHIEQITKAISARENTLLLQIHEEMYKGKNEYKLYTDIQKLRKEKPMVEEAWQQLLTVYGLNMDGDNDVS